MPARKPTTVAQYIEAAPREGQPHLRKLRALLRKAAPNAEEAIKWGQPFYIEPRFVFSFSAYKAHFNFTPPLEVMKAFEKELQRYKTTKGSLQVRYSEPLPEAIIRRMAEQSVRSVRERQTDTFW